MNIFGSSTRREGWRRRCGALGPAGLLLAALGTIALPAAADETGLSQSATPRQFQVTGSYCVMPCMNAAKERARGLENSEVVFSKGHVSGLMIRSCSGKVAVDVHDTSRTAVIQELRRRYGEDAVMSAAQLDLPSGAFKGGKATCTSHKGATSTLARFLSIEPRRITLLTDSGVVYELTRQDGGDRTGSVEPTP